MSFAAERQLLGTILARGAVPDALDALESISDKHFTQESHRAVFNSILKISRQGLPLELGTILVKHPEVYQSAEEMLREQVSVKAINRLVRAIKTSRASHIAERMLSKAIEAMKADPEDISQALTTLEANLSTLDIDSEGGNPELISSYGNAYLELLNDRREGKDEALCLDVGLEMSINRTDLIVVGGQPGMGKTALALFCAEQLATQGKSSVVFSLEMEALQVVEREVSRHSKLTIDELKNPANLTDEQWSMATVGFGQAMERRIWIDDCAKLDMFTLKSKVRKLKAQQSDLSMVIVDYITLMSLPGADRRDLQIGEVTRQCKLLAKELKVPVMLLSQLNRSSAKEKREPNISDLRDSGAIEQDADKIIFPYRDEVHDVDSPNKGLAKVLKRKVRDGIPGDVLLGFALGNFTTTPRRNWSEEEEKQSGSQGFDR